jgi:hypothetical protein
MQEWSDPGSGWRQGVSGKGRGAAGTEKGWLTQRPPVEMKRIFLYFYFSVIVYISQFRENFCLQRWLEATGTRGCNASQYE